ncbi:GNAT family N-acetyltransferase [Paracoccus ravus]|uniref:GNAT family N-acetyltransferase n=1 Tax=Paracoccus ravus TaxID=2447760 RepID=UPI00106E7FD0|nr:GNAT family N-acetyltransferase [Paracoccus ravus]
MSIILREMGLAELDDVLDWAAAEGWNPGLADAAPFFAADPKGFFLAELDEQPVAAISVVNHDADFAFLGLYICRPEWRGHGIGLALWNHALRHAGDRSVGLDGVAAQQANYARSGFVRMGSSTRFTGALEGGRSRGVRRATSGDFEALHLLDRQACGFARKPFLREWTACAPSRLTVLHEGPAGIDGFATIRLCREGGKIGPIIAPNAEQAVDLARAAVAELPVGPVSIDLPEASREFAARLVESGFHPGFTTARMSRGPSPRHSPHMQAIASMELG